MSIRKNNQFDWSVEIHREPESILRRLDRNLQRRIDRKIQKLAQNPRPEGAIKLVGHNNLYRVRVGDWRISYAVEKDILRILILEIAPRGDAYRRF